MEKGAIKISSGSTAAGGEPALLARRLATKFQGLADRGETKGVENVIQHAQAKKVMIELRWTEG